MEALGRVEADAETDFIGHPIADAGAAVLIKQERLEGGARMVLEALEEVGSGEGGLVGLGREVGPPWRITGTLEPAQAAEHARVVQDEGGGDG